MSVTDFYEVGYVLHDIGSKSFKIKSWLQDFRCLAINLDFKKNNQEIKIIDFQ